MKQSIGRLSGARLLSRQAVLGFGMAAAVVAGVAACGGSSSKTCPNLPIANGLIGQSAYNISPVSTLDGKTLQGPRGSVAIGGGYMYVPDTLNNRVLAFTPAPASGINSTSASFAIGQVDTSHSVVGLATVPTTNYGIGLSTPTKASVSDNGTQLVVADSGNNRVLIWNSLPNVNTTPPDVIIGQPNATTRVSNNNTGFGSSLCPAGTNGKPSQCNLNSPTAAMIAGGQLFVVDRGNSRVLIWNTVPTASGTPASVELGQANFTTGIGAIDTYNGTNYVLAMNGPSDLWTNGIQLAVTDTSNHRVLFWTNIPNINNDISNALVIGQTQFAANSAGSGQLKFNGPYGVTASGANLFVGDTQNNRVLKFSLAAPANGLSAIAVFGQQDYTHTAYNDTDQNNIPGNQQNSQTNTLPAQNVLYNPQGVAVSADSQQIYVTDSGNSRIMQFAISSGVDGSLTNNCNGVNPQL